MRPQSLREFLREKLADCCPPQQILRAQLHAVPHRKGITLRASCWLVALVACVDVRLSLCPLDAVLTPLEAWCRGPQPAAQHVAVHEVCGFV